MKKLYLKAIGSLVGQVCEIASYVLVLAVSRKIVGYTIDNYGATTAGYSDAVDAIMKSDMYSHDKGDAVSVLNRYESAEFYKAIVHIAEDSSMYSHDKVDMIRCLCEI